MRQCHHCKAWLADDEPHDCWTTTEAALTDDLSEDLRDAWERLRETAVEFGEQRIYASGTAIMFARDSCYFFRPSEAECARARHLFGPSREGAAGASRRAEIQDEACAHRSRPAPRRSRSADYGLVTRSLRVARQARCQKGIASTATKGAERAGNEKHRALSAKGGGAPSATASHQMTQSMTR
jgi:hypothetical protein